MKKRKVITLLAILIVAVFALYRYFPRLTLFLEKQGKLALYSYKTIELPDRYEGEQGFTCTGLYYDKENNEFLIGNAGKIRQSDEKFEAEIEILDSDFSRILRTISCYKEFPEMKDIQGICMSDANTIWLCSYNENLIRAIDINGKSKASFPVDAPSGIAYQSSDNTLWVLTDTALLNCSLDGTVNKKITVRKAGQDQLYLDEKNNILYFSAGNDYHGDSYIYKFDINTDILELEYVLKDSYAIEGISIIDDTLYVLNDGLYHDAEIRVNLVSLYNLSSNKKRA